MSAAASRLSCGDEANGRRRTSVRRLQYWTAFLIVSLALFVLPCTAQTPGAPLQCTANSGVPPVLRAEGLTELVGDLVLTCTGGNAGAAFYATFTLYFNTNVTSRSVNGVETDALLLVDEGGLGQYPQGTTPTPAMQRALKGAGANQLVWSNVLVTPPGQNATRTFRFTNIRVHAAGLGLGPALTPTQVVSFVSISPVGFLPVDNPQQILGFIQQGMVFDTTSCAGTSPLTTSASGSCSGQNNAGDRNLIAGTTGNMHMSLRYKMGFWGSLRAQLDTGQTASNPGNVYRSESGFVHTATFGNEVGMANHGTRLYARFENVPQGVRVFVTTTWSVGTTPGFGAALIDVSGAPLQLPLQPNTPAPLGNTHILSCPDSPGMSFPAVEVPITSGSGTAVWEVTAAPMVPDASITFGVAYAHSAPSGLGQVQVRGYLGPSYTPAGDPVQSSSFPIPRFSSSAATTLSAYNNFGGISVAPATLTAGTTTNLTIQSANAACMASVGAVNFTTAGVAAGIVAPVNSTTWTTPVTVAANAAQGSLAGTLSTSAGTVPITLTIAPAVGAPAVPTGPSPAHASTGRAPNVLLSWNASANATSYDVYFGTTSNPPLAGTAPSTYLPVGPVLQGQQYFWKVVARSSMGIAESPVWSFTTGTLSDIRRIYLQNQTTNAVSVWFMGGTNGAELLSSPVVQTPMAGWRLVARGDFDKNGTTDLVLQNQSTFQLSFWYMTGPDQTTLFSAPVVASPVAGWDVVAAADFDVNGTPDLILQNRTTNALSIWYLSGTNGTTLLSAPVFGYPISGWRVVGTGDFDRNGIPDIVFQNQTTYAISVWYMATADSMVPKAAPVIGTAAAGWRVRGISDFNRDSWADIVFQNEITNAVSVWYMTGSAGAQIGSSPVIGASAANWSISVVQ